MMQDKPIEVFYSYSHQDEKLRDELEKHLSSLKRQGVISSWHDRQIPAGGEWMGEIDEHLNTAQIILLLVSADFIASDYCCDIEVQQAVNRHEAGEAQVIPIILRPVDWEGAPFAKLQALPKDAEAVTSWANQDEAFKNVARGIRKAIEAQKEQTLVNDQLIDPVVVPEKGEKRETETGSASQAQTKKQVIREVSSPKESARHKLAAFLKENGGVIGVIVGIAAILGILLQFVDSPSIQARFATPTYASAVFTLTPNPPTATNTSSPNSVGASTTWECPFQSGSDEELLRSLIEAEAEAVEKEEIETINLIFFPDAIVAEARGEPSDPAPIRYAHKFKNEDHRNIEYFDFTYESLTATEAVVTTKVTGEWFDGQNWRPYGAAPGYYDINRWEFRKVNGCWRIAGFTYNLSLVELFLNN